MIKSFFIALFGLFFSLFAEGFSRIIIAFFHKVPFQFFGIEALPGVSWVITLYVVSIITTWLGAMLAMSMSGDKAKKTFFMLTAFFGIWIIFEILVTIQVVPLWYVLSFPFMTILGLILSHFTFKLNQHAISDH